MVSSNLFEKTATSFFSFAYAIFYGAGLLSIVFEGSTFQILQIAAAAMVAIVSVMGLLRFGVTVRFAMGWVLLFILFVLSCIPLIQLGISNQNIKWMTLFALLGLSLLSAGFLGETRYKGLFVQIFCGVTFIIAIAVAISSRGSIGHGRLAQGVGNPIWVGRAAGVPLIFVAYKFLSGKSKKLDAVYALISAAIIVLTGSRGPAVAVICATFSYVMLLTSPKKIVVTTWKIVGFSVLMAVVVMFSPGQMVDRFTGAVADPDGGTISIRANLYRIAIEMINQRPLGWGGGGFALYSGMPSSLSYPHNLILEAAVEWGIPFALVFTIYIVTSLRRGWRLARFTHEKDPILVFFVGFAIYSFINSLVSGDITSPKDLYLMIALFGFGLRRLRSFV